MPTPTGYTLRPFQERVYKTIMSGQSVILQAPTGAGKTRASLYPFLENLAHGGDKLPLTCRYAVPLRVLARQFFSEYEFYGHKIDTSMDTRLHKTYEQLRQKPVQIQTGEQSDDPKFESALTFCTIDQLLASGLGVPYGIGGRQANLNVAAILSSYLVLDEFHLFPYEKGSGARLTTLELLRMARLRSERPLVPFVLMTATFSTSLLAQLADVLDARIVSVLPVVDDQAEEGELDALNAERVRTFHLHDTPLSARAVLDAHTDSSLVVCNTVRRSQEMYAALREQVQREGRQTRVLLLHSRFTSDDRKWLQKQLENDLSKQQWKEKQQRDIIVVATQVIEVGLDISATRLHSEIAPANSLIQRAGRCARFAGQQGEVHIYPLPEDVNPLPYTTEICTTTQQALAAYSGQHVGFAEEQQLIDAVHTAEDAEMIDTLRKTQHAIRSNIVSGWRADSARIGELRSKLIRDVQQVSIIIHPDPDSEITERPWQWESFGMHPGSLIGAWDALADYWGQHGNGEAFCRKPEAYETAAEAGERLVTRYRWKPVSKKEEIRITPIVALHPTVATYDPPRNGCGGLGFLLRDGKLDESSWPANDYKSQRRERETRQHSGFFYTQESYIEHITGLLRAYQHSFLMQQLRYPARVLEEELGLPAGAIDRAVRLAIACHDIGKLGTGWQQWCEEWQQKLENEYGSRYAIQPDKRPFAHTDYDGSHEQRELQRTVRPSRPHHACESAELAAFFIESVLIRNIAEPHSGEQALARATVAAIARHHAATSQKFAPVVLCAGARDTIRAGLEVVCQGQHWTYDLAHLDMKQECNGDVTQDQMTLPTINNVQEALLYFLLVRVLRLTDQRSFDYIT